nr:glycosyltransferase family 1 protein [Planobispora longispora]
MRIALISEHANPLAAIGGVDAGGQNVHVAALAAALADRGHEVVVYTRRDRRDLPAAVALHPGVTVEHVPAGPPVPVPKDMLLPYMPAFAAHLRRRWAAWRPHVAHAHFWMSGLAALKAARDLRGGGVPVLQTFHALGTVKRRWQGTADTSPPERTALEADIGRRAQAVVATCADEVNELLAMGVPAERVAVVPCGVDLTHFRPEGPAAPRGWRHRVLSIGRMVPQGRRHPRRGRAPPARHRAADRRGHAGRRGGPETGGLAAAHGIAERVKLLGSVDRADVPALMRSADVVVSVPWYEPFGIVPLEAMACGIPVVASAVGGHLDTVAGCGTLVPPRRPRPGPGAARPAGPPGDARGHGRGR